MTWFRSAKRGPNIVFSNGEFCQAGTQQKRQPLLSAYTHEQKFESRRYSTTKYYEKKSSFFSRFAELPKPWIWAGLFACLARSAVLLFIRRASFICLFTSLFSPSYPLQSCTPTCFYADSLLSSSLSRNPVAFSFHDSTSVHLSRLCELKISANKKKSGYETLRNGNWNVWRSGIRTSAV